MPGRTQCITARPRTARPGGIDQLRSILLSSDVDVRERLNELPEPFALPGEPEYVEGTTITAITPAHVTSPTASKGGASTAGSRSTALPISGGRVSTAPEADELGQQQLAFLSDIADSDEDCSSLD